MSQITAEERWIYEPDGAVPPGATLEEWLEHAGMTQADLSRRTGLSTKHVNQLVKGGVALTPEVALLIERVTSLPARFWNRLEADYRSATLRVDEEAELSEEASWLQEVPWRELVKRDVLESAATPADQVRLLYQFFGVANRDSYRRVWRAGTVLPRLARSQPSNPHAVNAWLRIGELRAETIPTDAYNHKRFREALSAARKLTFETEYDRWEPELRRICAEAGVAIVIEPELPNSRVNGAARWLTPVKALVQLSFRYHWYDVFWFTFFHEAAHLLKHSKRRPFADERNETKAGIGQSFIDDGSVDAQFEAEADTFATRMLIPSEFESELARLSTEEQILAFADRVGIAPGIVVGRLQFEKRIPYNRFVNLKHRFSFG